MQILQSCDRRANILLSSDGKTTPPLVRHTSVCVNLHLHTFKDVFTIKPNHANRDLCSENKMLLFVSKSNYMSYGDQAFFHMLTFIYGTPYLLLSGPQGGGGGGTSSNFQYPGTAHEKQMDPIGSKLL